MAVLASSYRRAGGRGGEPRGAMRTGSPSEDRAGERLRQAKALTGKASYSSGFVEGEKEEGEGRRKGDKRKENPAFVTPKEQL